MQRRCHYNESLHIAALGPSKYNFLASRQCLADNRVHSNFHKKLALAGIMRVVDRYLLALVDQIQRNGNMHLDLGNIGQPWDQTALQKGSTLNIKEALVI